MAGDTLRDAFRAELDNVIRDASPSISWTRRDLQNTTTPATLHAANAAAASQGWFEIDFMGGSEEQYTFGAGSSDLHRETGQVTVRAVTRLGAGDAVRDTAERYVEQIRTAFRKRRFMAGSTKVFVDAVQPMGGGFGEGGEWVESFAIAYRRYNVG